MPWFSLVWQAGPHHRECVRNNFFVRPCLTSHKLSDLHMGPPLRRFRSLVDLVTQPQQHASLSGECVYATSRLLSASRTSGEHHAPESS